MLKENIPPGYIKLQDLPKKLKETIGVDISYRGIRNYFSTGLIPKPIKFRGHRDKYFMISEIAGRIWGLKYCSVLFDKKFSDLEPWFKKAPGLIETLPGAFIYAYSNYWRLKEEKRTSGEVQTLNILAGAHIYLGAVMKALPRHRGGLQRSTAGAKELLNLFPYPDKNLESIYARANEIFYKDFENAILDIYAPAP